MRKNSNFVIVPAVLALLCLGLLAGTPRAEQQVVPPTGAPPTVANPAITPPGAATPAVKWQYKSTELSLLDSLGAEGWEAYAVTSSGNGPATVWLKKRVQ